MYIFFDECKVNKKIEISLFIGYFIINSTLFIVFGTPLINLTNSIILTFILSFIYVSSISKKVIATVIIYAISFSIETILFLVLQVFKIEPTNMNIVSLVISKMIFYLVILLVNNFKHIKASYKISLKHILIISSISIFTIYIAVVMLQNPYEYKEPQIVICLTLLLIINIFIFYMYDVLNKTYEKELEKKLLEQQNDFYIKQLKMVGENQENIRFIKHDINNHFVAIKGISNESDKINDYINNILNLENISNEYANSGNSVIDSILNYKLQEAQKNGIEIELDLTIPYQLNIRPYDIGVILGNLLDNAIEAASQNENDKKIKIVIYYEKNNLSINIINTFNGNIIVKGNKYKTTKNKFNHGFGLLSVEKALEKYDGEMDISYTDSLFSVKILMYNNAG